MKIRARINNNRESHYVSVATNDNSRSIEIPPKTSGYGSGVNGGELLFLALATCYCNDIYREAGKRGMEIKRVEGEFGGDGEPEKILPITQKLQPAQVKKRYWI